MPTGPRPSSRPTRPQLYRQAGDARSAARAQAIAGRALREWGRYGEAREQLTAALDVLRADPDTDTVRALGQLATLEVFAGSPAADVLSAEALALGQDLPVDDATLAACSPSAGFATASPGGGRRRPPISGRPPGWPRRPATASLWVARWPTWPMR